MVALAQLVMTNEQAGCNTANAPALCSLSRSLGGTGQEGKTQLWLYSHIQGVTGVPSHVLAQDSVRTCLLKRLCSAAQLALSEHCSISDFALDRETCLLPADAIFSPSSSESTRESSEPRLRGPPFWHSASDGF